MVNGLQNSKPTFEEKILLVFSKNTESNISAKLLPEYTPRKALNNLVSTFGNQFLEDINNKDILDYGCGFGYQVLAMAQEGARSVTGYDIRSDIFTTGLRLSQQLNIAPKVHFSSNLDPHSKYDIIVSQDGFEHYREPAAVLSHWSAILAKEGKIYLTFGPLWFSPFGSHMRFFTQMPWVNILFSENTVMRVRRRFRSDGAHKYEEVEGGLNKMTVKKFENLLNSSNFTIEHILYQCVKNLQFLKRIPHLRELFVNKICCILKNR